MQEPVSRIGQLRAKLDKSGIAGNPVITDPELAELVTGMKAFQDMAIDWKDQPLVECLSRHIGTVQLVIDARKMK